MIYDSFNLKEVISIDDKFEKMAYHEAGHLVAWFYIYGNIDDFTDAVIVCIELFVMSSTTSEASCEADK